MSPLQIIQNCFVLLKTHMFKLVVALILLVFMQYMFDFMVITHRFLHPYTNLAEYNWSPFWKSGFNLSLDSLYNKKNFYFISRQAYSIAIKNTSKIMPSVSSPINIKSCPLNPPNLGKYMCLVAVHSFLLCTCMCVFVCYFLILLSY